MSEAPERIWAFYTPDDFDDTATITAYEMVQHGGKEYRRADLPPTLSAAIKLPEIRELVDAAWSVNHDNLHGNGLEGFRKNRDRLRVTLENLDAALAAIKEPKT